MSPEQVRGEAADARSDIFALGLILYEMLTGQRAFQKPTSAETMAAILNEAPPQISQLAPAVPPALQHVVHCCLEKNADRRFQNAADLAFALEALSDSSGIGKQIAFYAPGADGRNLVWIRALNSFDSRALPGTDHLRRPCSEDLNLLQLVATLKYDIAAIERPEDQAGWAAFVLLYCFV